MSRKRKFEEIVSDQKPNLLERAVIAVEDIAKYTRKDIDDKQEMITDFREIMVEILYNTRALVKHFNLPPYKRVKTEKEESIDICIICFENTKKTHVLLCKICNECICIDCVNKMRERSKFETCLSCCREIGLK